VANLILVHAGQRPLYMHVSSFANSELERPLFERLNRDFKLQVFECELPSTVTTPMRRHVFVANKREINRRKLSVPYQQLRHLDSNAMISKVELGSLLGYRTPVETDTREAEFFADVSAQQRLTSRVFVHFFARPVDMPITPQESYGERAELYSFVAYTEGALTTTLRRECLYDSKCFQRALNAYTGGALRVGFEFSEEFL